MYKERKKLRRKVKTRNKDRRQNDFLKEEERWREGQDGEKRNKKGKKKGKGIKQEGQTDRQKRESKGGIYRWEKVGERKTAWGCLNQNEKFGSSHIPGNIVPMNLH